MPTLDKDYWETRYQQGEAQWDMGSASTALIHYCQQLDKKDLAILIPGCGNGHEAAALCAMGFTNITIIDIAQSPIDNFKANNPALLETGCVKLICGNFFTHTQTYDLIIEQTFFCALPPSMRPPYAAHMHQILKPGAKLMGLLFNFPLTEAGPPFGGSEEEYRQYFEPLFAIKQLEKCYNSIKPREGRELFFILQKAA